MLIVVDLTRGRSMSHTSDSRITSGSGLPALTPTNWVLSLVVLGVIPQSRSEGHIEETTMPTLSPGNSTWGFGLPANKAVRGGSWSLYSFFLSSSYRICSSLNEDGDYIGFRVRFPSTGTHNESCPPEGEVMGMARLMSIYRANKGKDASIPCVLVQAGKFLMGSPDGEGFSDEHPQHPVKMKEDFWISEFPITNAQYQQFCEETGRTPPPHMNKEHFAGPDMPVVGVTWHDAAAYAEWVGGELLTEEEWEYAARGPENNKYPWGSESPTRELACYWEEGRKGPDPVGAHPEGMSWCGAQDMAGNVWEWCKDVYRAGYQWKLDERAERKKRKKAGRKQTP